MKPFESELLPNNGLLLNASLACCVFRPAYGCLRTQKLAKILFSVFYDGRPAFICRPAFVMELFFQSRKYYMLNNFFLIIRPPPKLLSVLGLWERYVEQLFSEKITLTFLSSLALIATPWPMASSL